MEQVVKNCAKLAKELKKAPPVIANEIKESLEKELEQEDNITKIDVIGGYLNFFISKFFAFKK